MGSWGRAWQLPNHARAGSLFCTVTWPASRVYAFRCALGVVAAGSAWAFAFLWGWGGKDWPTAVDTGTVEPLRGANVAIDGKDVVTDAERAANQGGLRTGLAAGLKDARKQVFGNNAKMAGREIVLARAAILKRLLHKPGTRGRADQIDPIRRAAQQRPDTLLLAPGRLLELLPHSCRTQEDRGSSEAEQAGR